MNNKDIQNKKNQIILEVALMLNKELYDEKKITYKMYKYTEEKILRDLKNYN